ncbi:caspase-3-like [Sinocyclocheilus grahami]|uniref:caspase-3-like n=1 Tax=Sinocyclocheilus grahami TaxID=75366 RepID=UPI0007ACE974|nr:PREDICTED: caspase-3-like [Sinocyclocheilus grahami]
MQLIQIHFDYIEIQSLTEEKIMSFCKFPFTADKRMKYRALIVSVENFYSGADLNKRNGVKRDSRRLHKILTKLGFSVDIRMDIDANEICEAFKAESKKTVKDCFVGVISSHGEEGVVFGADGRAVKLAEIYSYFGGPSMADKSKLFLIQACRGHELDGGAEVEADSSFSEEDDGMSELFSIPIDTAVMYATSPGYAAFMHPLGSVLIQTLCDLLEKEGGPELEITRLLTRLNYQVAYNFESRGKVLGGKKQMPCFVTRFTREVFPFMDSQTAAAAEDLSLTFAATQLIDEPRRSRKSSIS